DGSVLYYGGNSGSFSEPLPLGGGNNIAFAEVCTGRYDGGTRVFYLELISDEGVSISNGTRTSSCTTLTMHGDVMGFHGTGGDSYFNALGFYTMEPENTYETPGWSVTDRPVDGFANWATASGVKLLSGDFDGDGLDDLLATGGPGWTTLPIAFSQGDGTFVVTNRHTYDFARWTGGVGVQVVVGDFDGDGLDDLAATGGSGWNTMLMAFSQGDGTFTVTNHFIGEFASWTQAGGVKVVAGDFNGDGRDDVAAVGGPGWNTQPIAFSHGNGTFHVTNHWLGAFPSWAQLAGVEVVAGDFSGDGKADIALAGGRRWTTQPVAYSRGDGTFSVINLASTLFPVWAENPAAKLFSGDFNGDGKGDLAVTGAPGWSTVPVASKENDTPYFDFTNDTVVYFAEWTAASGAKVAAGDFNGDGKTDLAVTGIHGWPSIGVAFSKQ
ncbi:MAG: FG-GAP-like repeat-containing protein, partial [Acidobacteriota bacterium]